MTALAVAACDSTPPVTLTPSAAPTPTSVSSAAPTATPTAASSPTATPSPAPTQAPSPTTSPSPSPVAEGWPYRTNREIVQTLFPEDGRVVVVERDFPADTSIVMALDAGGGPIDGWPWTAGDGSAIQGVALGPDASTYVVVRGLESADFDFTWSLHRLSREGQEATGFPVELPHASFCELQSSAPGIAYVTCEIDDDDGNATGTAVSAVRQDASSAFTSPVTFPGSARLIGFGPDDLPVVAVGRPRSTTIEALTAQGATGWSTATILGDAQLDAAGRIRVTRHQFQPDACGAPTRTTYDLLTTAGRRLAGWPFSMTGWASAPAVLGDGSMVVVTAGGRAFRYTLGGRVAAGWPVRGNDVSFACSDGSTPVSDGNHVVVVGAQRVTMLGPGGRVLPGWPANPPGQNANACPGCTPGSGAMVEPILGDGPVTYVATYDANDRPRVATIDAGGTIENQVVVGARGAMLTALTQAPTGRVWAVTALDRNDATTGTLTLVAAPPPAP
jgi:hypothetical protein